MINLGKCCITPKPMLIFQRTIFLVIDAQDNFEPNTLKEMESGKKIKKIAGAGRHQVSW